MLADHRSGFERRARIRAQLALCHLCCVEDLVDHLDLGDAVRHLVDQIRQRGAAAPQPRRPLRISAGRPGDRRSTGQRSSGHSPGRTG